MDRYKSHYWGYIIFEIQKFVLCIEMIIYWCQILSTDRTFCTGIKKISKNHNNLKINWKKTKFGEKIKILVEMNDSI